MRSQFVIVNTREFDANPAAYADVRRLIKFVWFGFDQRGLQARRRGNPHGDVAVVMVVVGKHHKNFLAHKKRRLAVRKLLGRLGQRQANGAYAFDGGFLLCFFCHNLPLHGALARL